MKRPAALQKPGAFFKKQVIKQRQAKQKYVFPHDVCPVCKRKLFTRKNKIVNAILVGSESITDVATVSKQCNRCRHTVRRNVVTLGRELINTMSLDDMRSSGVFFVTSKTGFTIPFLELTYLRLLRGNLSPGQEAAVQRIYHKKSQGLPSGRRLRELLLRAVEGFAVAQRNLSRGTCHQDGWGTPLSSI